MNDLYSRLLCHRYFALRKSFFRFLIRHNRRIVTDWCHVAHGAQPYRPTETRVASRIPTIVLGSIAIKKPRLPPECCFR